MPADSTPAAAGPAHGGSRARRLFGLEASSGGSGCRCAAVLRRILAVVVATTAVSLALAVDAPRAEEEPIEPVVERTHGRPTDSRPPIVAAVVTAERVVALTFDDGPDPRWTPAVLEELRRTGASATFFATGAQARAHPELLRAIVAAGSEVANHTDTHPQMDGLDAATVGREVQEAASAIAAAGIEQAPYFRPPRGRYGPEAMAAVDEAGLLSVGWTVCLERWLRVPGPDGGVGGAVADVRPGGIVLAHDGGIPDRTATVQALPDLLDQLMDRGYRIVTLSELLRLGPPVHARPGVDPRSAPLTRVGPQAYR